MCELRQLREDISSSEARGDRRAEEIQNGLSMVKDSLGVVQGKVEVIQQGLQQAGQHVVEAATLARQHVLEMIPIAVDASLSRGLAVSVEETKASPGSARTAGRGEKLEGIPSTVETIPVEGTGPAAPSLSSASVPPQIKLEDERLVTAVPPPTFAIPDDGPGYEFHEARQPRNLAPTVTDNHITVRIAVPPTTKKGDVVVMFKAKFLYMSVRGHRLQPAIIDGMLNGSVNADSCSWSLEAGAGRGRVSDESGAATARHPSTHNTPRSEEDGYCCHAWCQGGGRTEGRAFVL